MLGEMTYKRKKKAKLELKVKIGRKDFRFIIHFDQDGYSVEFIARILDA